MDVKRRVWLAKMAEKARKHPRLAREMGIRVSLEEQSDVSGNSAVKDDHFELQR